MSTSIIDYIFRELAITYLGRHDLAHVLPEDLRADALGTEDELPDFNEEEVVSERVVVEDQPEVRSLIPPRSSHIRPANGPAFTAMPAISRVTTTEPAGIGASSSRSAEPSPGGLKADRVRVARQKGYEGDPCPNCQQLTLVRSGACAKCDTCGETSGCG
jgi:ribonucleoside-diphosphate reductase alpha chain